MTIDKAALQRAQIQITSYLSQRPPLVTTGLDPVVHADHPRKKRRSQRTISSHKSRQSGFIERIRSIFHLRDQCLMFFSR
jgi:hypothetical protein